MPKKLTYQEVKEYIESFDYKLLSDEYIDNKTKLKMICPCGHEWECNFRNFKTGRRCRTCSYELRAKNQTLSYECVKEYIEMFDYKLLSKEYKNNHTKLLIQCNEGHKFEMDFSSFKQGERCPKCKGVYRYNYDEVKEYYNKFGYELISNEYNSANNLLIAKCPNGHLLECTFNSFKNGETRCGICKDKVKSKGEDVIADILIKSNIAFLKEYNFKDCKGKRRTLPFDFYLPNYNICIEYDGTPHYKLGTFKNGLLDLMNRKYLDDIKTKYCKDNNIELIRIPYWEKDNIEEILNHKIITR